MDEEVFIFNGSERTESFKDMREEFELKRAAWERLDIQNYQFTRIHSWVAAPWKDTLTFEISEGQNPILINPEVHWLADRPFAIPAKSITEIFDMVDNTFSEIERIKREGPRIRTLTFNIKYHPRYHFPMKAFYLIIWADRELGNSPYFQLIVTEFIPR